MKNLKNFVNEQKSFNMFRINKYNKPEQFLFVKDRKELIEVITERRHESCDLDLTDIDVSEVIHMEDLFEGLDPYTIDISNWKFENCTYLSGMFAACRNLQYVNMKSVDMSNIENINRLFTNCKRLEKVEGIENWDISNLRACGQMFFGCEALKELDLSKWKPKKLTHTYSMFANCYNIESIGDISKWDVSTVWNLQYMFADCKKLEFTGDLNNWNIDNTQRRFRCNYMFKGCKCWENNKPKWYKN